MVEITKELLRKRAEHNQGELESLEEITLHQYDIEKIELLEKYCRKLRIIYLQNNQIMKIENLSKLKYLEYLNLALNNIRIIENLGGCESLKKLDLTVNFVENLECVRSLKDNYNLKELYLTGNPCTQIEDYRLFVIHELPQLTHLDGILIEKSERIKANQLYEILLVRVKEFYDKCCKKDKVDISEIGPDEPCPYTPESRLAAAREFAKSKEQKDTPRVLGPSTVPTENSKPVKQFRDDGTPMQTNQGKYQFRWIDDESSQFIILDVTISKYLDTSLIDVNVEEDYIQVTIKGKLLQLLFPEPVVKDEVTAQRSKASGHLLIKIPRKRIIKAKTKSRNENDKSLINNDIIRPKMIEKSIHIEDKRHVLAPGDEFIDDDEVPPLI